MAKGPDAEDLAQEAIIRAWCAIDSCRTAASFESWLCRIAINAAYDYHRSAWKRRVVFLANPHAGSANVEDTAMTVQRRETARRLRTAVAALPQKQCIPIWMHYFEQFSLVEIAALEGTTESTIRSRIRVGMNRLQNSLSDFVNDTEMFVDQMPATKGVSI